MTARTDSERLDWLEREQPYVSRVYFDDVVAILLTCHPADGTDSVEHMGDNYRQAIDAAMADEEDEE